MWEQPCRKMKRTVRDNDNKRGIKVKNVKWILQMYTEGKNIAEKQVF